jgi:hypothetical protein
MQKLANPEWDATKPVQTEQGAAEGLRVGHNKITALIEADRLEVVYFGRLKRITTASILEVAATGDLDTKPPTKPLDGPPPVSELGRTKRRKSRPDSAAETSATTT